MIVRITQATVDPEDAPRAAETFRDRIRPTFESFEGCEGIEMHMGIEEHSGDQVDVVTISRWASRQALDDVSRTGEYAEAMDHIRSFFHQSPIVRHFESID